MTSGSHHIRPEDLSASIDGELGQVERSAIANHLATCSACHAELAELRATVRLLHLLPQISPRRSLHLGMEHNPRRPRHSPVIRLLPVVRSLSVAAVIVFMVAAGALFLGSTSDAGDRSPAPRSSVQRETGASDDASQGAGTSDERLIDRGEAASSGDDPLEDLTSLQEAQHNAADEAAEDVTHAGGGTDSGSGFQNGLTSKYGSAIVIGLGVLALVLVSLWLVLVHITRPGRQSHP